MQLAVPSFGPLSMQPCILMNCCSKLETLAVPSFGPLSMQPPCSVTSAVCSCKLAVPSFGPLSMQRVRDCCSASRTWTCSTLVRAVIDATDRRDDEGEDTRPACSTLVRAVIDATQPARPRHDHSLVLQYPRSGRYRCNILTLYQIQIQMSTCSTLVRAVIDATSKEDNGLTQAWYLAVPSFGPLSMQRGYRRHRAGSPRRLQYPRSGRYRCNS